MKWRQNWVDPEDHDFIGPQVPRNWRDVSDTDTTHKQTPVPRARATSTQTVSVQQGALTAPSCCGHGLTPPPHL